MSFLKNIFGSRKNKIENISRNTVLVNISDIDDWVKTNCSDIDSNYFGKKFSSILEEISNSAENLLKIKFEADTDPRIKQRVQSNIDSYVKHVRSFIKKIDVSLLKENIKEAIDLYEENLNNFNLQTQKNFLISSALFKEETFRVSNCFRNFSLALNDLRGGLLDNKSVFGLDVYGKISKTKNSIELKKKVLLEEKEKRRELDQTEKEITDKKQAIRDFTNSDEYKAIVNSDKKKEFLESELVKIKYEILSILSVLEPAFRKLLRIMPNIDIKQVEMDKVLDPLNNKIFEYSKELKHSLKSLDIKEGKKEKISDALDKVLGSTFESLRSSYFEKVQDIKNIDTMMIDSQVSKVFIDLNYKINSLDYKKNRLQNELEKINKRKLEIEEEFSNLANELEGVLSSASGHSVKLNI